MKFYLKQNWENASPELSKRALKDKLNIDIESDGVRDFFIMAEEKFMMRAKTIGLDRYYFPHQKLTEDFIGQLASCYQDDSDKALITDVLQGNLDNLRAFVGDDPEKKDYLKNMRFDDDGMALRIYRDCSGWSLLNAAAYRGQKDVAQFLISEVGMDVNTMCYGVTPIFCCFPSMHDDLRGFSSQRLETARILIEHSAILDHKMSYKVVRARQASGNSIMHTACFISDDDLRQEAFSLLLQSMKDGNIDCNIKNNTNQDALDNLVSMYRSYDKIEPQVRLLKEYGLHIEGRTFRKFADQIQHTIANMESQPQTRPSSPSIEMLTATQISDEKESHAVSR